MPSKQEIDTALQDVRKAYRLIYLYQRRVLDLCNEIVSDFESEPNFYQWSPSLFGNTPIKGNNPTSKWAWQFSPLYDFCVFYLPENVHYENHQPGDWMLVVRITADSGYTPRGNAEPDPRDFEEPSGCESCVRLYIYYCSQAFNANWFNIVFLGHDWPSDTGEDAFDNTIRTFGKKFSLADASDVEGVGARVKEFTSELKRVFPDTTKW